MDLEKNIAKIDSEELSESSSVTSSEPSIALALKPNPITDLKPSRDILPEKMGNSTTRYLKFNFWTTYRKIFTVIYTANMATLVALCIKNKGTPAITEVANASSANLMLALLFRQENFVNLCYEIAVSAPHSLPLSFRRKLAKVFHYGGAHSGSGVAAVCWFLLYVVLVTRDYIREPDTGTRTNLITSWILITMFTFIVSSATPRFRILFHDYFEATHRFAGWVALIVFWVHNGLVAHVAAVKQGTPIGLYLIKEPNFWFFCVSTSCSILSWSRLRRREVFPEVLSDHAIRLHFKYRPMQPFYGLKVSSRPLLEWHAFATIPDEDNNGKINGFSVVVSNAGDWTREIIKNPSTKLWVRGYPLHGLLYTSRLFKRIVVVATGSGIGPCLSLLYADVTPRRVLWSTPHPETTYGPKIMNAVLKADPDAVVWNTRTLGRPDMVALTYQLVLESKAEAVFIISNPKVTRKVVYGMETRGIPAYGAIFDS
ncbi:hypothetical protein D9619_009044 [Psilocybe cf. subviscida]|uniref:Non-ribosomal peptide synthetase n=1 Tax=Psilocybe cf. subviscida TaxID=2480587 RepID=A0A8H5FAR8_9AGAR|nr:hypothetical protein D9619_009044 [Psilocybe cf. subviscida]